MDGYRKVSGLVFALVAVGHGIRAVCGWPLIIGGTDVPIWVSWTFVAGAGLLSVWAFVSRK